MRAVRAQAGERIPIALRAADLEAGLFYLNARDGQIGIVGQDALDHLRQPQGGLRDDADARFDFNLLERLQG